MGRWRVVALTLAVLSFGLAGFGSPAWLPVAFPPGTGRTTFFWLGIVCFLAAAWGRPGT